MTDEHPPTTSAARSRFIAGISSYCDSWCERCRFQSRCRVFRDLQRQDAIEAGAEPPAEADDDPEPTSAPAPAEWLAFLDEANREPTAEELAEAMKEEARLDAALGRDPVVLNAVEYSEIVLGIAAGFEPLLEPATDPLTAAAMDAILRLGCAIGVKVRRASRGHLGEGEDDEFAREDANRTAKLVRLLIRESREAWDVLRQPGHAIGDGVPTRMIARLDALDQAMASRFPAAMDATRPGLDE